MPVVERVDKHGRQLVDPHSVLFAQNRLVFITEPITDQVAAEIIKQLLYLSCVSNEDITMIINSPGGSVTAGLAIFDTMQGLNCDIATVCLGLAASMGAFLLSAGTRGKRFAMPNSEVMIHQVMGSASGQTADVQIAAQHMIRTKDRLNRLLSDFTGQSLKRIRQDTDRDYFMTAQEAVAYGIVDHIKDRLI